MRGLIKIGLLFSAALSFGYGLHAQVIVGNYPVQFVFYNPNGNSCNPSNYPVTEYVPSGVIYTCQNGTVASVGGGAATSVPFSGITSATNTTAAMLVGTGASLGASGTGTIAATTVASAATSAGGQFPLCLLASASGQQGCLTDAAAIFAYPSNGALTAGAFWSTYFQDPTGNNDYLTLSGTANTTSSIICRGHTSAACFSVANTSGNSGDDFDVKNADGSTGLSVGATGHINLPGLTNAATGDYVCYNAGLIEYDSATCTLSLAKYKMDVEALSGSLAEVMKLRPVEYRYRPELKLGNKLQVGLIADEVAKIDPRIAAYKNNGELESVDYEHMTAVLASAIQEQQKEIRQLKKEVVALRNIKK